MASVFGPGGILDRDAVDRGVIDAELAHKALLLLAQDDQLLDAFLRAAKLSQFGIDRRIEGTRHSR